MTPQLIEVKKLDHSPHNARRTHSGKAAEELKASILAHGLMQNLVVTLADGGRFRVIAGGRRLTALRQLQAEGRLPSDYSVPCQLATDDRALEMSLAENTVRQAMHPADEFEAFARLIEDGQTASEVSMDPSRYEVSEPELLRGLTLSLRGKFLQDHPDSRRFPGRFASAYGSCRLLPSPTGRNPLDFDRYEFPPSRPSVSSTTESLESARQRPDLSSEHRGRLLQGRHS